MNINKRLLGLLLVFLTASILSHAQTEQNISGIYKARGYGWIAEIDTEIIRIYDYTSMSCMVSSEYPRSIFDGGLSVSGAILTMKRGVTKYTLDHIPELPDLCTRPLNKKERKDPLYNFDVLWQTFNEQYAYFKERNIDWQKLHDIYRNQINISTEKARLFHIFNSMLEELNDGHVGIEASDKTMKRAAIIGNWDTRPDPDFKGLREAVVSKYLKNPKRHNISKTIWGKINDSTGYLQINSMGVQGYYGITDNTSPKEAKKLYLKYLESTQDPFMGDISGMNKTMKKVLKDLRNTKRIILDLRFNGGGEDMVGLTALRYFIDSEKNVFNKKNRFEKSFTKPYPYTLSPAENVYTGELYILQSSYSASATEILLLASLAYGDIKRLGSRSEGIFSDILDKKLPNGWEFGLSNQVYEDMNGISYEAKGIPVHEDFNYPKDYYKLVAKLKNDLNQNGDLAIEKILKKRH